MEYVRGRIPLHLYVRIRIRITFKGENLIVLSLHTATNHRTLVYVVRTSTYILPVYTLSYLRVARTLRFNLKQ